MMSPCGFCGNEEPYAKRITFEGEHCDRCGGFNTLAAMQDVYFKGPYVDEHLATEEHPGPKTINTRAEKAYWLKTCRLREDGDRTHGASKFDPIAHRHAQESLRRKHNG